MKIKLVVVVCFSLITFAAFSQNYTYTIPSMVPARYNAIGGFHVTDTTDYYTMFANPAGIDITDGSAVRFTLDLTFSSPEFLLEVGTILYNQFIEEGATSAESVDEFINLIANTGFNVDIENFGPLTFGTIYDLPFGSIGWGIFSEINLFVLLPTFTHLDALVGFDNLLQLTYAAPIIENDNHYLSFGFSAKGVYQIAGGLVSVEPLSLLTDTTNVADVIPIFSDYGFSSDYGVYYEYKNMLSVGLVWRDFISGIWANQYSIDDAISTVAELKLPTSHKTMYGEAPNSLDIGVGFDVPLGAADFVITNFMIMVDYHDMLSLTDATPTSKNPWLNLSMGTEITLFDILSLRAAISETYLNAGVGLCFGPASIDFSIFGKELGLEPGSIPQLNISLALSVMY